MNVPHLVQQLQLPVADPNFNLAKVVCSHGLFMMAPNQWDPTTATLSRPLHLASSSASVYVRVAQPAAPPAYLIVSVFTSSLLSTLDRHHIQCLVRRMLGLSEASDRTVEHFHQLHPAKKEKGFGRLFRSPTLFEDVVKCILLCNCHWGRTLSMARALCEFHHHQTSKSIIQPQQQSLPQSRKRKHRNTKNAKIKLKTKFSEGTETTNLLQECKDNESTLVDLNTVGDFPTAEELAHVDVNYFANRCKLGYRAKIIVSVAKYVVSHKIEFREFEQIYDGSSKSQYNQLDRELRNISGLGPFTRASILMCMGFYHKIPCDTETRRHLKQFHAVQTSSSTRAKAMENKLEKIYGEYAPLQYLAYWYELWGSYEANLGKAMNMAPSDYKLATAKGLKKNVVEIKVVSVYSTT